MLNFDLLGRARRAMLEAGFEPEASPAALAEAQAVAADASPASSPLASIRDLRSLDWSSIDNSDSRDLDQIEFAERLQGGSIRLLIGIADVASLVPQGSAIDQHALRNTTSIYTPPQTFLMLPEALSKNKTSLLENEDRQGIVIEMLISAGGSFERTDVFLALLRNKARLDYDEVGGFLEGETQLADRFKAQTWLASQLQLQAETAQRLIALRKRAGALTFSSSEARMVKKNGEIVTLTALARNKARDLIESFMIAANIAAAGFLKSRGWPIVDRVVTVPRRWDRIREVAAQYGTTLPLDPDQKLLSKFLAAQRAGNEDRFADLSLTVVKLLGAGEYVIEYPDGPQEGHFGLAVDDYSHSTAPNRRFADLVLQRLIHACLAGSPIPYSKNELEEIAIHCTERETAARKLERLMGKVLGALLLQPKIGQQFRGIITGATIKGIYARLFDFPAEGKVIFGETGLDVGDKVLLKLIRAEPERGFIDLEAIR